ncbi:hypothetical protein Sjap_020221 [Stephania japonica]|uniref:Uncharacterized protein n=1 Tax=Stephania japonica TaxID=461633 RepID=A0AAP0F328_9MAGN
MKPDEPHGSIESILHTTVRKVKETQKTICQWGFGATLQFVPCIQRFPEGSSIMTFEEEVH